MIYEMKTHTNYVIIGNENEKIESNTIYTFKKDEIDIIIKTGNLIDYPDNYVAVFYGKINDLDKLFSRENYPYISPKEEDCEFKELYNKKIEMPASFIVSHFGDDFSYEQAPTIKDLKNYIEDYFYFPSQENYLMYDTLYHKKMLKDIIENIKTDLNKEAKNIAKEHIIQTHILDNRIVDDDKIHSCEISNWLFKKLIDKNEVIEKSQYEDVFHPIWIPSITLKRNEIENHPIFKEIAIDEFNDKIHPSNTFYQQDKDQNRTQTQQQEIKLTPKKDEPKPTTTKSRSR